MLGEPDKSVLTKMTEYLHHRGPDGNGIFLDESCGFAHTRLAIVDVAGSPQPIFGQGKVAIVNGEIYNYKSLEILPTITKLTVIVKLFYPSILAGEVQVIMQNGFLS